MAARESTPFTQFLELDDIKEATNITLSESGRVPKLATVDRVPSSMMALEETSKGGDPALLTYGEREEQKGVFRVSPAVHPPCRSAKGDVIGNRSDFCVSKGWRLSTASLQPPIALDEHQHCP